MLVFSCSTIPREFSVQVELMVVNNSVCAAAYGKRYGIPIHGYHLCAGPISDGGGVVGKGTCVVQAVYGRTKQP